MTCYTSQCTRCGLNGSSHKKYEKQALPVWLERAPRISDRAKNDGNALYYELYLLIQFCWELVVYSTVSNKFRIQQIYSQHLEFVYQLLYCLNFVKIYYLCLHGYLFYSLFNSLRRVLLCTLIITAQV